MRFRSLAFASSIISLIALAACAAPVDGSTGETSEADYKAPKLPDLPDCSKWNTNVTPDGVIVRLGPLRPGSYWSCPTIVVDGQSVEGLMTADLIAWYHAHPLALEFVCGVGPTLALPVMYQAAWPQAEDENLPYCVFQSSAPLADLDAAVVRQIGSHISWKGPLYGLMIPEETPSGGGCPSCNNTKRMP